MRATKCERTTWRFTDLLKECPQDYSAAWEGIANQYQIISLACSCILLPTTKIFLLCGAPSQNHRYVSILHQFQVLHELSAFLLIAYFYAVSCHNSFLFVLLVDLLSIIRTSKCRLLYLRGSQLSSAHQPLSAYESIDTK